MANQGETSGSARGTRTTSSSSAATPGGAQIHTTYLVRRQESVAVNRTDLEDIKEFDGLQAIFSSLGMFFVSGGFWLGVEKVLEQSKITMTPVIFLCAVSILLGAVLFFVGWRMRYRKVSRIERIFDETRPMHSDSASAG